MIATFEASREGTILKRKFIILNNGLRDHRGHYFETSISIAEAARRAGLHPILATHVDCRTDLLPMWLESYPIFCTDHWMAEPPVEPPDLSGILLDPYGEAADHSAGSHGAQSVREFLATRFETFANPPASSEAPGQLPVSGVRRLRRFVAKVIRKSIWSFDRAAFYFLPPFIHDGAAAFAKAAFRTCVPRILQAEYRARFRARALQLARRALHGAGAGPIHFDACTPEAARSLRHPVERPIVERALLELRPLGLQRDLEYSLIFKRDLERLLALTGAGPGDHILLGTAHAREVLAVQLVGKRLGESRMPEFHCEFRHPLFYAEPNKHEMEHSGNIKMQRGFLSLYESNGPSDHVHFYTDTEELSHDYGMLTQLPFGVLPIPFRSELIESRPACESPLRLVYLGEARDEKGFPWMPRLIDELMDEYVKTGAVRFLLQANVSAPQYNPQCAEVIEKLKQYPREYVELFGVESPLSPQEYYALVSQADAVLLPYDRNRYRACSSGTLAEAIAGGRPAVVPANSWLSAQLPFGAGETFHDYDSFAEAVKRLIRHYDEYRTKSGEFRATWLSFHTPDRLISRLVDDRSAPTKEYRAAA